MTTIPFFKAILFVLVMTVISACSSTRPYTSGSPENLTVKTDIRTGTAWLNIYEVDNTCATKYLGTVDLIDSRVRVAIPINKPSYLLFTFASSSFLSGNSSTSYGIYLTPRAGYKYDATISYIDDMYVAMIHEQDARGGVRHEISRTIPKACVSK
jgi:hypothetical protein